MFNDELSNAECEDLVQRLAKCVFPFMCAHGRPSMVPLVGLGSEAGVLGLGIEREESVGRSGFVDAWKEWRKDKA
jgi:DNA mismatch repair protein MLH3